MLRVLFIAALFVLLAACTPKTPEGAACDDIGGVGQCPEGQRCGVGGACSLAAMACELPICTANSCSGLAGAETLSRCDQSGVCASLTTVPCSPHQTCNRLGGTCDCDESACDGTKASICDAGGDLVACQTEAVTSCHYADPPVSCGTFRECSVKDLTSSECACKASPECAEAGTFCRNGNTLLVTCDLDDQCLHARATETCDPGESCVTGACVCPDAGPAEGDSCSVIGDTSCAGPVHLTCQLKAVGSPCRVWTRIEDCSGKGLVCSGAAPSASCTCPVVEGTKRTFFADSLTPPVPGLDATGADVPGCRFTSLGAAILAASDGDTVKATGAGLEPMVFKEGPLTVRPGMTLSTTDTPPAAGKYVIEPTDAVGTSTLVTMRPGATLAGFEVRNSSATGSAVEASCGGLSDTATVTVESVKVTGQGTLSAAAHFQHGVSHSGRCSLVLGNSTIEGVVESGVYVFPVIPISLVMTSNVVRRNLASEIFTIDGQDRTGGGIVLRGTAPQSIVFTGNSVLGNGGDQVLVFMSGDVDLSAPDCQSANVFACYSAPGVGVSSFALTLAVRRASWPKVGADLLPGSDYVVEPGRVLTGTGTACPIFPAASCPQ